VEQSSPVNTERVCESITKVRLGRIKLAVRQMKEIRYLLVEIKKRKPLEP
jgi:hypothetical protein